MIHNSKLSKKKAFTLVELLIVIAIIGILFIVLVSKVDFATDKAKATGVQTDFRSFQLAFETVSKEKAGFNSFGWNTGDDNANGVRDSVDEGDANEDGIYQDGETWTGHKKYLETWTNTYSLIRPGTTFAADGYDKDAIFALETAINKNLDPTLQITIDAKTGLITMANGAQDPWNTQYHGAYISAEDGMDRGAIVMFSNGANQKFGTKYNIANGLVKTAVSTTDTEHPDNNKDGADDYVLVVCYTYTNGYGETGILTDGFSTNQNFFTGNTGTNVIVGGETGNSGNNIVPNEPIAYSMIFGADTTIERGVGSLTFVSDAEFNKFELVKIDNHEIDGANYTASSGSTKIVLKQEYLSQLTIGQHKIEIVSHDGSASCQFHIVEPVVEVAGLYRNGILVKSWSDILNEGILVLKDGLLTNGYKYYHSTNLKTDLLIGDLILPDDGSITSIGYYDEEMYGGPVAFAGFSQLTSVKLPSSITNIPVGAFYNCHRLRSVNIPEGVTRIELDVFSKCYNLVSLTLPSTLIDLPTNGSIIPYCINVTEIINHSSLDLTEYPRSITTGNYPPTVIKNESESQLKYVGDHVFKVNGDEVIYHHNYSSESTVVLPDSYNGKSYTIEYWAFTNNHSIEHLIIPECVKIVDRSFVNDCPRLKSITILGHEVVTTVNSLAFLTSLPFENVYVPADMVEAYKAHSVWAQFKDCIKSIE